MQREADALPGSSMNPRIPFRTSDGSSPVTAVRTARPPVRGPGVSTAASVAPSTRRAAASTSVALTRKPRSS
ncbi:hypothetical protein [Streptomyces microflavus]|uniref:hypothetical protein n=1 Tax=Streptomyces microflavus TaxID=1919 RepID=UPI0036E04040